MIASQDIVKFGAVNHYWRTTTDLGWPRLPTLFFQPSLESLESGREQINKIPSSGSSRQTKKGALRERLLHHVHPIPANRAIKFFSSSL